MSKIFDIEPQALIEKASEELKKVQAIQLPEWATFVKTGVHKERPPAKQDWWYIRAASVLRKIYIKGPIGVSKLRTLYGGKQNRGHKTEHFYKGSGNIIRKILQQLGKAGFVKEENKGIHKGRSITKEGKAFLDKVAAMIGGKAEEKPSAQKETAEQPKEANKTGQNNNP